MFTYKTKMLSIKLIQYYCFCLLKLIFSIADWLRLTLTGGLEKQAKYETSAKVSKVHARFMWYKGLNQLSYDKEFFFYVYERFDHPSIVLNDRISLYTVTPEEAVFVDCGQIDVFGSDITYTLLSQYEKALKIITLPIESFHLIARQIPVAKAPLVHIANHGRCGSTLMRNIFQEIPKTFIMSESYAMVALTEYSRTGALTEKELKKMCFSIIKCFMKHANFRQSDLICIEDWSQCIFIADILFNTWPAMKHIYMFRQPVSFTQSWEKLQVLHKWYDINAEIIKYRCGIGHKHLSECPVYGDDFLEKLSRFGKLALFWISYNVAYKSIVRNGYPIVSVKFEDFLKDPKKVVLQVFKHFEIPPEKLPDLNKVLAMDTQSGTFLSSRSADQKELEKQLTPITDAVKEEVNMMCRDYNVPMFWDTDVYLENNINEI